MGAYVSGTVLGTVVKKIIFTIPIPKKLTVHLGKKNNHPSAMLLGSEVAKVSTGWRQMLGDALSVLSLLSLPLGSQQTPLRHTVSLFSKGLLHKLRVKGCMAQGWPTTNEK